MRGVGPWLLALAAACAGPSSPADDAGAQGPREAAWRPLPHAEVVSEPSAEEADPDVWTLDAILARVGAANPNLGQARAHLELAHAARREANASLWPQLSLGLDFASTDNPGQAFGMLLNQQRLSLGPGFDATPGVTENWREEVRLDWALFAPGRREQRLAAGAGEEAARLGSEAVERRLVNAAVQAWLGLRAAAALEGVAAESVSVVEQRLEQTRKRHDEGVALRADVLRFEVRLAAARQDAARARLEVSTAESMLNALMGRGPHAPLELAAEEIEVAPELPAELDALLDLAAEQRLDLRAAGEQVRMAGLQCRAARAERLPVLGGFAAYDIDGRDPTLDTELDSYLVGVGLRLPFSAGTGARIEQARAGERMARERERALSIDVGREVRSAWEELATARETDALAAAAVDAAEEAYRIVAAAQDAGGATATDVLEAADMREQARVRAVAARAGVQMARAKLAVAVGGVR